MRITEYLKKFNWPYAIYREIATLREQRKRLWAEAVKQFEEGPPEHGSLRDYKIAMRRHRVNLKEYNTYEFWHLSENDRKEYLSENELKSIYRKTEYVQECKWFDNKLMTHVKYEKYMQRDWICPSIVSYDTFSHFVSTKECIAKPWKGSLGRGVFKVNKDDTDAMRRFYDECIKNNLIIEECVKGHKELEEFHPQSLNTIRLMTMTNIRKLVPHLGCRV